MHTKTTLQKKIDKFIADGSDALHMVLDFDRTMTQGGTKTSEATSWYILQSFFGSELMSKRDELYHMYRGLEIAGKLTQADAVNWWESSLALVTQSHISFDHIKPRIARDLKPRKGIYELFTTAKTHTIPTVILSAGVKNIIDYWCSHHSITPDLVISTELIFDPDNIIVGWKKESLVHILNKHAQSSKETATLRATRPNTIIIGDSLDDATMATGDESVIRILIDDPRSDGMTPKAKIEHEKRAGELFDMRITEGNLTPIVSLLEKIIQ